jgi:hypothetical protein
VRVATAWIQHLARLHHHDPPKIAAAFTLGAVRRSNRNRWHMAAWLRGIGGRDYISSFVGAYNAYRSLEHVKREVFATPPSSSALCAAAISNSRVVRDGPAAAYQFRIVGGTVIGLRTTGPESLQANVRIYVFDSTRDYPGLYLAGFNGLPSPWPYRIGNLSNAQRVLTVFVHALQRTNDSVHLLDECSEYSPSQHVDQVL